MDSAQSILHKAPPADLEKNLPVVLEQLSSNPDAADALKKKYPIPFRVFSQTDDKPFLVCPFNRVSIGNTDRYRSPWTNKLHTERGTVDDVIDAEEVDIRPFEAKFNDVFESYKNLYYGHEESTVSSVYLKQQQPGGAFTGWFGIKKENEAGSWFSMSLVSVDAPEDKQCQYTVETYVLMILLKPGSSEEGATSTGTTISASINKETSKVCKISKAMLASSHIENIGTLIEANEIDLRSNLERVHIPKTQEVLDSIKKQETMRRTQVNPLMGMIMDSSLLKKKLASGTS